MPIFVGGFDIAHKGSTKVITYPIYPRILISPVFEVPPLDLPFWSTALILH